MNSFLDFSKALLAYVVACMAVILMLRLMAEYTSFETDVAFLGVKQDYISNSLWLSCFYIHVFSTILCLIAGLTQFSGQILSNYRWLHKLMGKIYVVNIVFINFPVAMVMAVYANGGFPSKLAFIILDLLWFSFTLKAWLVIQKGDIETHRKFMIRSFALTFSAITLRSWKTILVSTTGLDEATIYMIDAWLGFVPNLLLAETYIYFKWKRKEGVGV